MTNTPKSHSDDLLQTMPWGSDSMTLAEFEQWVASRAEAGRAIDIEICEVGHFGAGDFDPYGLRELKGEEWYGQVSTNCFVRSSTSNGWIHECDLPAEKLKALDDRLDRDHKAYDVVKKRLEDAAFKSRDESNFDDEAYWIVREAVRDFAVGRVVLDVRTIVGLVLYAIDAGITSGRAQGTR